MSTPNPLIPQGSLQSQGTSNVRVAVATIVAIHIVFFGGLLLQGCKRDAKVADGKTAETNAAAGALSYPPIDSNSLYYSNTAALPVETPAAGIASQQQQAVRADNQPKATNLAAADPWKPANLNTPAAAATVEEKGPGKEYTIVRGDNFAKIAKAQGTTLAALKKANPAVDPAKIKAGQKIMIPAGAPATAESAAGTTATPAPSGSSSAGNSYTVKAGDTLTKIAKTHGVTVGQLRSANNLKVSRVNVGQKLKIPAPAPAAGTKPATTAAAATNTTF